MKRLLGIAMLAAIPASASVTLTVPITTVTPTAPRGSYIRADIVNCQNPTILNSGTTIPQSQRFPLVAGSTQVVITIPDNVTQIACDGNQLSYYTFTYVANGVETLLKSVELPQGIFNLANLAPLTGPPWNPGVIQGPPGPAGAGTILKTNGGTNTDQTQLNLAAGSNITLNNMNGTTTITAAGGGSGVNVDLQTNSVSNPIQNKLNLIAGSNVTLTPVGGNVTIAATGGGGGSVANTVYTAPYATIELAVAACGGVYPCQIILNSALTQSTAGTYTIPAGVAVAGQASGSITPGATKTLSFANTTFSGPPVAFFTGAGTITGLSGAVKAEWFGVTPYLTQAAAGAGANDLAKAQAAVTATTAGGTLDLQCRAYHIGGLVFTKDSTGISGACHGTTPTTNNTSIVSTSASENIVTFSGVGGPYISGNVLENVYLMRTVLPTGTAAGVYSDHVGGMKTNNVIAVDSVNNWYLHDSPSYGFTKTSVGGGWLLTGYTTPTVGFYLDSADGVGQQSLIMDAVSVACDAGSTSSTRTGLLETGTALSDINFNNFFTAGCDYGIDLNHTGSSTGGDGQDIHFTNTTLDGNKITGIRIRNSIKGMINFDGGWVIGGTGSQLHNIDVEDSSFINFNNIQSFGDSDILIKNSNLIGLNAIQHYGVGIYRIPGIKFDNTQNSRITGSSIYGDPGGSNPTGIVGVSFINNSINNLVGSNVFANGLQTSVTCDGTSSVNQIGVNSYGLNPSGYPNVAPSSGCATNIQIGGASINTTLTSNKIDTGSDDFTINAPGANIFLGDGSLSQSAVIPSTTTLKTSGLSGCLSANTTTHVVTGSGAACGSSGSSGTVTNVSSADANATVASPTTTPIITIVSAPKLATPRAINGVNFDGTAPITVAAAAGTLTGSALATGVQSAQLTSITPGSNFQMRLSTAQLFQLFNTTTSAVTAYIAGNGFGVFGGGVETANLTPSTNPLCYTASGSPITNVGCASSGGSGISGATAGQALIAGSATTATSSKALAGSGAGITTGPVTQTAGDIPYFGSTTGEIADSNLLLTNIARRDTANTMLGYQSYSFGNVAGFPAATYTGTPFAGTGTQSVPLLFEQPTGATAVTTWNTGGTFTGVNAQSGFAGNFFDYHVNGGATLSKLDSGGNLTVTSCTGCGSSATINPSTQYANTYYSDPGTATTQSGLAAPTTNGNYFISSKPTTGVAVAPTWTLYGTVVSQNTGTSGANVPLLNGANTWSGVQTITNTAANSLTVSETATASSGSILQVLAPNVAANNFAGMVFGKAATSGNSTFLLWYNTANPYGSMETFSGVSPFQIKASQIWLNGGSVFVGNTNATGGATLPVATGLFNVGTTNQFSVSAAGAATGTQFNTTVSTITYSATPALVATSGLQTITLTGNAAPTITGIVAGQRITFQICQNATGGFTWTWPALIHGGLTIGSAPSTCSMQSFDSFTGTTLVAESAGITGVAP